MNKIILQGEYFILKKIILFLFLALNLTGCANMYDETLIYNVQEEVVTVSKYLDENYKFTLFVEKYQSLALHEPEKGALLGVSLKDSQHITQFEEYVGKPHAMYVHEMVLGEDFPESFILRSIANRKVPNIIVTLPNNYIKNYDKEIEELSKWLGQFNWPMFVQFVPVDSTFNPDEYLNLYRNARKIFKENAEQVAFVWTVNTNNVFNSMIFYPGDDYVDWVGIDAMQKIDNNIDKVFNDDIFVAIDFLYYTFQERKPIMITKFGVSHFSTINHTYRVNEAAEEIARAYNKFATKYPRIKAINYVNEDQSLNNYTDKIRNNFAVTSNKVLTEAYKKAINYQRFLSTIDNSVKEDKVVQLIRCPFSMYKVNGELLISKKSVNYTLGLGESIYLEEVIVEGQVFYKIVDVQNAKNIHLEVDNINNVAILKK
jgi:hypothetical protein